MVFNYYQPGYTDPLALDNCLADNCGTDTCGYAWNDSVDCYDLMKWDNTCTPSQVYYADDADGYDTEAIDDELSHGYPVLAWVSSSQASSHMVVITGKSGSTYLINDPWDDSRQYTLNNGALGSYAVIKLQFYHGPVSPPPPSCPPENCTPGNEVGRDFFVQVLERLTDVPVSDFAVDALVLWEPHENTLACWNPLATTWEMEVVCDFNSAGVQHYQSQDMGTQATANTLAQGCYDNIRRMLRVEEFNREGLRADLDVWGTCSGQTCNSLLNEWEALWNDQGGGSDLRQAGNLEISPSNPQVNQETTFSFEVHNYGDQSLTLQNIGPGGKGPPNGQGGDWNALTHNITVGGHQTVPVSASRVFGEGTWCVEKIIFQKQDGGWFDLPANGYQQAKCFEVGPVPPQPHPGEVPDNPGSGWAYKEPDTWQSGIWTYHDDATLHWDVPEANCDLGIYQYRAYFGPNSSGLGGDSDNLLDNEIVPSNEVTVGPIDSSGTYYLRLSTENDCCCENGEGSWDENRQCFRCRNTNWDTVFIYKLDNLEPPNPDHATDLRGSQSGQWTYHDDTTFVWDIPSDPGGSGVKEHHIYFGMDPGGTGDNTVSIPQLAVGPMTEWGTYYLRINTEDNAGNRTGIWTVGEGVWDTIFTYRFDNGEPPNPVLATEIHGVQNGEATDINDPTFTWDEPVDPGGSGICCYHIYFGQDSQGTSDTIVSNEQYSPGVLGSPGVYYLRINTEDNAGNRTGIWTTGDGVWNTIFTYNYQTTTPTATPTPTAGTPTATPTPTETPTLTLTPTNTPTPTQTPTPTSTPRYTEWEDLSLENPGFERGNLSGWTIRSGGWEVTTFSPHSGSYSARKPEGPHPGFISQDIDLSPWQDSISQGRGWAAIGLYSTTQHNPSGGDYLILRFRQGDTELMKYERGCTRNDDWGEDWEERPIPPETDNIRAEFGTCNDSTRIDDAYARIRFQCVLFGDLDCNCAVDVADIMMVASRWHTSCDNRDPDNDSNTPNYEAHCDLDNDCDIDIVDIMLVVKHWGETCP